MLDYTWSIFFSPFLLTQSSPLFRTHIFQKLFFASFFLLIYKHTQKTLLFCLIFARIRHCQAFSWCSPKMASFCTSQTMRQSIWAIAWRICWYTATPYTTSSTSRITMPYKQNSIVQDLIFINQPRCTPYITITIIIIIQPLIWTEKSAFFFVGWMLAGD